MQEDPMFFTPPGEGEEKVCFFTEDVEFDIENAAAISQWIESTIEGQNGNLQQVNYIFCSDAYLHQMNVEYLQHDTLTDVITFPYALPPLIQGDIFISIERVRENALQFSVPFVEELLRVMVHGVLHLCGHGDKTSEDKKQMTLLEDAALAQWSRFVG